MEITKEKLKEDFHRDTFLGKIHFKSDDETKKSTVIISVSWEFLSNFFKKTTFNKAELNKWYEEIVKKWEMKGNKIFHKSIHYDIYSITSEGKINGLKFLTERG